MAFEKGFVRRAFKKAATGLLALGLLGGIGGAIYKDVHVQEMQVTITGAHKALLNEDEGFGFTKTVYETDKGDFSNTLNPLRGKFLRSTIGDKLEVGKTYTIRENGLNLPLFNEYRNILSATPVPGK